MVIFPIFYKFEPVKDSDLAHTLVKLCNRVGLSIEGVYSFNLSKNTKKANAGFAGLGKSRRVILGDNLLENFQDGEISTVLAHELGHYSYGHLWKGIVTGAFFTFAGLWLTGKLYSAAVDYFGFPHIYTIAALPLLSIFLMLFGLVVSPLQNSISRRFERSADRFAVKLTGKKEEFVSALNRLAALNLADVSPHPIIEFIFYSHPSIEKRIRYIEKIEG
ncbi:MAG: M48 family metalloprotease [Fidelibacterota bacterium]